MQWQAPSDPLEADAHKVFRGIVGLCGVAEFAQRPVPAPRSAAGDAVIGLLPGSR